MHRFLRRVAATADPTGDRSDASITQQWTRRQTADGIDSQHGWLRTELEPGARYAAVHVAFCPAFGRSPSVRVEQLAGPTVSLKPALVLPHGARIEVRAATAHREVVSILLAVSAETS
jgi:hypothetical protein